MKFSGIRLFAGERKIRVAGDIQTHRLHTRGYFSNAKHATPAAQGATQNLRP